METISEPTLGQRLREALWLRRATRKACATAAGMSEQQLGQIILRSNCKTETLERIVHALGFTVAEFYCLDVPVGLAEKQAENKQSEQ